MRLGRLILDFSSGGPVIRTGSGSWTQTCPFRLRACPRPDRRIPCGRVRRYGSGSCWGISSSCPGTWTWIWSGTYAVLGVALVMEPDEGKAPATPRVALLGQVDIANVSVLFKQRHQIVGHRTEGKIANPDGVHAVNVTWGTTEATATSTTVITVGHFVWKGNLVSCRSESSNISL